MIELKFKPEKIPPDANELTICQYENWPDGKRRTKHYKVFDKWVRENRPNIQSTRYHCWPYSGIILCV